MTDHLQTGGRMPAEYLDLYLWRDVYHCDPRTIDPLRVLAHLKVLEMEGKYRNG